MFDEPLRWEEFRKREGVEMPATRNRALDLTRFRDILSRRLENARNNQAKYYDEKHISQTYNVSDKVLLNAKNIKTTRSSKKLDHKYVGSFEVVASVEKQTYRLRLSVVFNFIHDVFHVSLLESFRERVDNSSIFLSVLVDEEEQYEVESVLDSRL